MIVYRRMVKSKFTTVVVSELSCGQKGANATWPTPNKVRIQCILCWLDYPLWCKEWAPKNSRLQQSKYKKMLQWNAGGEENHCTGYGTITWAGTNKINTPDDLVVDKMAWPQYWSEDRAEKVCLCWSLGTRIRWSGRCNQSNHWSIA